MTTIDTTAQLTMVEAIKRVDPKGDSAIIAEILQKKNPILRDLPWTEANDIWGHEVVRRASLPAGSFRRVNQGVDNEASLTVQVREGICMLETYSEADEAIIDNMPNPAQARMQEATAAIEGLGQTMASKLFYGNASTDPEEIDGVATRLASLDASNNVIGQGGTGSDESSVYIIQPGIDKVFMVYPRGSKSKGVSRTDKGKLTLLDSSGKKFEGYRDHYKVHFGLVVKDPRCVARLANIDPSGTYVFDEDNLIRLLNRMPDAGAGAIIYVNETVLTQMEIAMKDKANVNFLPAQGEGLAGDPVMYFRRRPVRLCEAILNSEDAIT